MRRTTIGWWIRTGVLAVSGLFLQTPASPAAVQVQPAAPQVRDARAHVVTLRAYDAAGAPTEQGSGFFVADGRIATNHHVLVGAERVRVFDVDGVELGTLRGTTATDRSLDLALLPSPTPNRDAGLRLRDVEPAAGDPIWVLGSPRGLAGTMTTGIVSALRERDGRRLLQISAPLSTGSSGGPVLDAEGVVVGIAVATLPGAQNLNFAIPAGDLERLLARSESPEPFPPAVSRVVVGRAATDRRIPAAGAAGDEGWRVDSPELRPGARVRAAIDSADYKHDGRVYDMYWFAGRAGQDVEISVTSTAIDPYVVVTRAGSLDRSDPWSATDDDGGEGTDALLLTELPSAGTYVVLVSSYDRSPGPYAIELRDRPLPDRWEFVARNAADADLYFDRRTLREADGSLRVWVYTRYAEAQRAGARTFDASKALFEFRCAAHEYRLNQYLLMRNEEVVGSERSLEGAPSDREGGATWSVASPDSVAEGLMTSVCSAATEVAAAR